VNANAATRTTVAIRIRRARADLTVRVLASSALWLSLLLVTYWWDVDGTWMDFTTAGVMSTIETLRSLKVRLTTAG